MPMTAAMSRSAAFTAIPSASTRQASFTTGKKIISTMSFSDSFNSYCSDGTNMSQIHGFYTSDIVIQLEVARGRE